MARNPKIISVVGARPNFTKIAPVIRAIKKTNYFDHLLVHTGQHYDHNMSQVFFDELGVPMPDINFNAGSSSHATQVAEIMIKFEQLCLKENPDLVLVVGDINSTVASALVVSKMHDIKLAHIEAGERSYDRRMPEEVNRVVTDILSDYLFCTAQQSVDNLLLENVDKDKIFLVGNVIVDNMLYNSSRAVKTYSFKKPYVLATMHRPSNTDNKDNLQNILEAMMEISCYKKIIFPMHPRTKKKILHFGLEHFFQCLDVVEPMSYLRFLAAMASANVILTDSGGIQVEAAVLGVPCVTMRENTEHMFTLNGVNNVLVGADKNKIIEETIKRAGHELIHPIKDKLYDGKASERIVEVLRRHI